jgi:outer membrane protein assembly factor BamD
VATLAALLAACGSRSIDVGALSSASDAIVWDAAEKAIERKEWSNARQYLKRIVDAFPQSEHQPEARIALADSYFEEGGVANYVLAVSAYREFLTLYPQHPRSDYAQFRAAESYFKQKNSPDRDQTASKQALEEYQRLLDIYPDSKYVEPAREKIHQCRQILARSNYLVGYFYQRGRQAWRAAIGRYETIVNDYPDYDQLDEVLFRLSQCLGAAGRYGEALPLLARLEKEYPHSSYIGDAQKLREEFPPSFTPATAAPPAPAPAPADPTKAAGAASARSDAASAPDPVNPPSAAQPTVKKPSPSSEPAKTDSPPPPPSPPPSSRP